MTINRNPRLGDLIHIENDSFDMTGVAIEYDPVTEFMTLMDVDGPISFHLWDMNWTILGDLSMVGA